MNEALMRQAASLQQAGRFAEAAQCYQQILRANPRHFQALFSLGMICLQTEQFDASYYDSAMVDNLGYRAPSQLRMLRNLRLPIASFISI